LMILLLSQHRPVAFRLLRRECMILVGKLFPKRDTFCCYVITEMKKLFIISSILLVAVLIFLGVYNVAFKKNASLSSIKSQSLPTNNSADPAGKKGDVQVKTKIYAVSERAVLGPFVNAKKEKIIYYSANDGTVWESKLDGSSIEKVEAKTIDGLKNVSWSPDGINTLAEISNSGGHAYFGYNHASSVGKKLQSGIDLAVWNNEGSGIIYKYFDSTTKKRSLNVANPDGSNWKQLADIPYQKISIAPVPQTSLVSFWELPAARAQSSLQTVGSLGGEIKTVLSGKYGADYAWAKDGKKAAVSFLAQPGKSIMNLGVVTLDGDYQDLGIPTLASKTAWSKDGKTIYYALAGSVPDGAVMPDDYDSKKFTSSDTFWKVDIETGQKDRIVETSEIKEDYDASQLMLTPAEDALLFVNRKDGKLYRISL
jgi:hypothetical protein